jgi:hypothetical protein
MRRVVVIACAAVFAGCGADRSESLPAACGEGPQAVLRALEGAPAEVRMDGTLISECFNRDASGADETVVGTTLIAAAQQLSTQARDEPEGEAALRLGYLVGAARRGNERNGLGAETQRRLAQEAGDLPARSAAFRRGERAGSRSG